MNEHPIVSVVIPVRNSQKYIRQLIDSLLKQDYRGKMEIILAGNRDDETWPAIRDHIDRGRVTIVEVNNPPGWVWRDSNRKRNVAVRKATGTILAFTDSKIQHPQDWISTGVRLLQDYNVQAVAGIMVALPKIRSSFFVAYTDKTLVRRNHRFGDERLLTTKNFGESESLPMTSNFFVLRDRFRAAGGAPEEVAISYEDYALAWKLVKGGNTILCTDKLSVYHDHRNKFHDILKEHRRSGRAAAQFLALYPNCPYAQRRKWQVIAVASAVILAIIFIVAILALGWTYVLLAFVALGVLGLAFLGALNILLSKDLRAILFPVLNLLFGLAFTYSFIDGWRKGGHLTIDDGKYLQT